MSDRARDTLGIAGALAVAGGLGWILPPLALIWLGGAALFAAVKARPAPAPARAPQEP
jgi:hypothetical protein